MKKVFKFIICVFGPLLLGGLVALLVGMDNYGTMIKPPLSPPPIVFPIVWSILYLLMGIGLYLVLRDNYNTKTIKIFCLQLGANLLWSFVFFNFGWYYFAAFWILVIMYFLIKMIIDFYNHKKIAGYLQFPYFIWLLIALYLAVGVAILN